MLLPWCIFSPWNVGPNLAHFFKGVSLPVHTHASIRTRLDCTCSLPLPQMSEWFIACFCCDKVMSGPRSSIFIADFFWCVFLFVGVKPESYKGGTGVPHTPSLSPSDNWWRTVYGLAVGSFYAPTTPITKPATGRIIFLYVHALSSPSNSISHLLHIHTCIWLLGRCTRVCLDGSSPRLSSHLGSNGDLPGLCELLL